MLNGILDIQYRLLQRTNFFFNGSLYFCSDICTDIAIWHVNSNNIRSNTARYFQAQTSQYST